MLTFVSLSLIGHNRNIIRWSNMEILVFTWQRNIYYSSISGNFNRIYYLRKKFLHSTSVKFIVIRRIIRNFEKNVTKISSIKIINFYKNLKFIILNKLSTEITISRKKVLHDLFISLIINICIESLMAFIIEPEWQRQLSKSNHINYYFRVRYCFHDVIEEIRKKILQPIYITERNISNCMNLIYSYFIQKVKINQYDYNQFKVYVTCLFCTINKFSTISTVKFIFLNIIMTGINQNFKEFICKRTIIYIRKESVYNWLNQLLTIQLLKAFTLLSNNTIIRNVYKNIYFIWLLKIKFKLRIEKFEIRHTKKKLSI